MINGLCTKCIDSVVCLYANVSYNLLNIIPYAGSLGAGCLTTGTYMFFMLVVTGGASV